MCGALENVIHTTGIDVNVLSSYLYVHVPCTIHQDNGCVFHVCCFETTLVA